MLKPIALIFALLTLSGSAVYSAERDPLQSRVPADQAVQARKLENPLRPTVENIEKGKEIFRGKGTCFTCHGVEGKGDGPAAVGLDPSPRDFTNAAFQKAKTDGELMWVIKNGSPGTAMIPMIGSAITEEEGWLVLLYIRSLSQAK